MSEVSRRELGWVALWTVGLSAVMLIVFALLGQWSWRVPLGALLGVAAALLNFYLLCRTVEKAVDRDPSSLRGYIRASQYLRLLMQGAVLALAFGLKDVLFHPAAALLPLFFPQIAVRLRPLWKQGGDGTDQAGGDLT